MFICGAHNHIFDVNVYEYNDQSLKMLYIRIDKPIILKYMLKYQYIVEYPSQYLL